MSKTGRNIIDLDSRRSFYHGVGIRTDIVRYKMSIIWGDFHEDDKGVSWKKTAVL